jgi:lipid A 4'-phosphatase
MKFLRWFLLIIIVASFLDLPLSRYFYSIGNDPLHHFMNYRILDFIYNSGPLPAHLTAFLATVILIASYPIKALQKWRNPCLVLLLSYSIGAGLIINGILKEYWGRPRPKQVEEFGGIQSYRAFYEPNFFNQVQVSKAFPCGHCAMGFYFFALVLVGRRLHNKTLIGIGYALVVILGGALSLTRMMQGGHFLTDTLFAALIMWGTPYAIDYLVYKGEKIP